MQFEKKLISDGKYLFKYRGQIPIILFLISIPIISETSYYNIYNTNLVFLIQCLGVITSVIGLLLRYYTVGTTAEGTSGKNRNKQIAKHLNTKGAYSVVRNPLYLGNYMIWLGLSIFSISYILIIITTLLFTIHYERIILSEENFLLAKFKKRYEKFAQEVPIFFPKFQNFKHSNIQLSIKRILKEEHSPTLTTILSFIYIDILTKTIDAPNFLLSPTSNLDWQCYILIVGITIYVIICLKLFKRYTQLLD
tara:strand:- start:3400 stop:4152 length:753 start_codon:yes stop_codon:yes gene_type:complete